MDSLAVRQLTGCNDSHLCELLWRGRQFRLTPATADALRCLARAAREQGIALAIASAHRDFGRQLAIWNAKAAGERAVLDSRGEPLDSRQLSERELVFAILRWSALPGASRHHWGSDLDIYDAAVVAADYRVQLTAAEAAPGGIFGALHQWLDERFAAGRSCGFFRPYAADHGGVAPEPWHLSYAPESRQFQRQLDAGLYREFLAAQPIALREVVLANFEEIYHRFVAPGDPPPPA